MVFTLVRGARYVGLKFLVTHTYGNFNLGLFQENSQERADLCLQGG